MSRRAGANGKGYTLLELLLVVVVVGIIAGLAMPVLVRKDDAGLLKQSAQALLAGMAWQEDEAVLTASQRGLQLFRRPGEDAVVVYQWYTWSRAQGVWQPIAGTAGSGTLKGVAQLALRVDEREVELPLRGQAAEGSMVSGEQQEPQVIFYSSGEISEFELTLVPSGGAGAMVLRGGFAGTELSEQGDGAG